MTIKYRQYWRKSSLKQKGVGDFFLKIIMEKKPKNFLEIGVFHGVTARNVCELLFSIHGNNFKYIGIDLFLNESEIEYKEFAPNNKFSNPFKNLYYKYILKLNPYSIEAVKKLLNKFNHNVYLIKGNSNLVLKDMALEKIDYVFLDGGHKYETVYNDLNNLLGVVANNGTILCDDYDLSYAPGVKNAINEFVNINKLNLRILQSRFAEITK
tara:strand:- start:435 stop:1067 length:633 start_codon:yes stop_codon:yes gene_type:complete